MYNMEAKVDGTYRIVGVDPTGMIIRCSSGHSKNYDTPVFCRYVQNNFDLNIMTHYCIIFTLNLNNKYAESSGV